MDAFILERGKKVYRAFNANNSKIFSTDPIWFVETLEEAVHYGTTIREYTFKHPVKLLNPMCGYFQNDYINKLSTLYPGTNGIGFDEDKIKAAIPFGLPNFDVQIEYLVNQRIQIRKPSVWDFKRESCVQFINNKHRYSEFSRDVFMINILKALYASEFHGFMTNIRWPSKLHDGFFNREICIFHPSINLVEGQIIQIGSGKHIKAHFPNVPVGDSWNRHTDPRLNQGLLKNMREQANQTINPKLLKQIIDKNK